MITEDGSNVFRGNPRVWLHERVDLKNEMEVDCIGEYIRGSSSDALETPHSVHAVPVNRSYGLEKENQREDG